MPKPSIPRPCQETGCDRNANKGDYCWMHYKRRQRAGETMKARQLDPVDRLNHYGWTITDDDCWEFDGNRAAHGYGSVRKGDQYGTRAAHRLAYEAVHGPIPDGLEICHTCDNPPCINPDHLWAGTHADNMADKVAKGRARGPVALS